MAVTQGMLNALVKAWASGAMSVSHDGRSESFVKGEDLEARIATVAAALGVANPLASTATTRPTRQFRVYADGKGL